MFAVELALTTTYGRKREGGESLEEMGVENSSYTEVNIPFFSVPSSSGFGVRTSSRTDREDWEDRNR